MSRSKQSFEAARQALATEAGNLGHLANIRMGVSVELGRKEMTLEASRQLQLDDVVVLDKLAGERMDVLVNGHVFAEGEMVVVADQMRCRVSRIVVPETSAALRMAQQQTVEADVSEDAHGEQGATP